MKRGINEEEREGAWQIGVNTSFWLVFAQIKDQME